MRKLSLPRRRRSFTYCLLAGAILCLIAIGLAAMDQRELAAGVMVAVLGIVWAAAVNFDSGERQRDDHRIRTWRA